MNKIYKNYLMTVIFQVMHGVPKAQERNIFRGMYEYTDDDRFESILQILSDPPEKEILEGLGKKVFEKFDILIDDRIKRSMRKRITINENAYRLLEEKKGQASILVKIDISNEEDLNVKGIVFSDSQLALDVSRYFFNNAFGTISLCEAKSDFNVFMEKLTS